MENIKTILNGYQVDQSKGKDSDLVNTGVGLLHRDNANWLFTNRILSRKGDMLDTRVMGISSKSALLYSYLRQITDDIRNTIPTMPTGMFLDFNDCITLARTGHLEKPYILEGREFKYVADYPKVDNIERVGKECFIKNQPKTKTAKWDSDLI